MRGIVLFVFNILAVSLSEAYVAKKPKIDVFEIRQNQRTKKLQVKPVNLQYDLESKEKESEPQVLINKLLQPYKKKKANNDLAGNILNQLKALREQEAAKAKPKAKKKLPIVMLVSPEYLDVLESKYSDQESYFNDNTRTEDQPKLGSNVVFHIVPSKSTKKLSRGGKLRSILRSGQVQFDDRTDAPSRHRIYYEDYDK